MKLVISSSQFGFEGKEKERAKMEKAISQISDAIDNVYEATWEDSGSDHLEISRSYDQDFYTVENIKYVWRAIKANKLV